MTGVQNVSGRQQGDRELPGRFPMAHASNGLTKLFSLIFAGAGIALLAAAGWTGYRQYTMMTQWPSVEAEVVKSQVTHHQSQSSRSTTTSDMYTAEIVFRYSVEGRDYLTPSTTGYSSSSYPEMKRRADSFPPGSRPTIQYNPLDPNDIRFNAGYNFDFFFLPLLLGGMGIVFTGFGVGFLYASRKERLLLCPSCGHRIDKEQNFCPNCAAPLSPL
jgi:hypothetical protein